jgi:hypothetical protein
MKRSRFVSLLLLCFYSFCSEVVARTILSPSSSTSEFASLILIKIHGMIKVTRKVAEA